MGLRTVFVLLLLIGGIAAGLYYTQEPPAESAGEVRVLEGRNLLHAQKIVARYDPSMPQIEMERGEDGVFRLVEPIRDLASDAMLVNLAQQYDSATMQPEYVGEEVTPDILRQTGLDAPSGGLTAEWPDGKRIQVDIGAPGVFGNDRYLGVDGTVYLGSSSLLSALQANVQEYREKAVFRHDVPSATRIEIERRKSGAEMERLVFQRNGARWSLEQRADFDLDQGSVRQILGQVLGLRVSRFPGGTPRISPNTPDVKIVIDGAFGRESVELIVGATGQMTGYVQPRGVQFLSERGDYHLVLEAPLAQLRSRLFFDPALVNRLEQIVILGGPGGDLAFERIESGFQISSPAQILTHPTPVNELLQVLRNFHVTGFVEDDVEDFAKYGLDADYITLRLRDSQSNLTVEIHLGDREGDVRYARLADSPHVVAVAAKIIEPLFRPWLAYVTLDAQTIPEHIVITEIRVTNAAGAMRRFSRDQVGDWRREGSTEVIEDLADTYDAARDLVATRAIDPRDYPLGAVTQIEFESSSGRQIYKLEAYFDQNPVVVRRPTRDVLYELKNRDGEDLRHLIEH